MINLVGSTVLGNRTHPQQTVDICKKVKDIEGDFCECGVAYGSMSALMANFITENKLDKFMHMADSFEGIPYPTEFDGDVFPDNLKLPKTGELKSSGVSVSSVHNVMSNFGAWGIDLTIIKLYIGWIEESIDTMVANIDKLAFLRIDVDLYRPTMLSLTKLGPKVSKGGIILVHDNLPGCIKAISDYTDFSKVTTQPDDGGFYWVVK